MTGSFTQIYHLQITGGSTITTTLGEISKAAGNTTNMFGQLTNAMKKVRECQPAVSEFNKGIQSLSNQLSECIQPGVALESALANFSAATGQTGKGLKEIESYARETAKTFGGTAADSIETYGQLLDGLSPEIAKVPQALAQMGNHVKTISKTMGGDTTAAADLLTTAMNQFQVSLSDPIAAAGTMGDMMNVMAAAAQQGTAGLPAIGAALAQSGKAAKEAGISFAETNAAIQLLDKAGKQGSEGGTALRNVMTALSQSQFLPKDIQQELSAAGVNLNTLSDQSLSLSDRLKPLSGVMNDSSLMAKLFGQENTTAAQALISGTGTIDLYTASIQGTGTAINQASGIMDSYSEKMSRQKARLDDLKITFFNFIGGIMPYVQGFASVMQGINSTLTGINTLYSLSESAVGQAIAARVKAMQKSTKEMFNSIKATFSSIGSLGTHNIFTLISTNLTYAFSYALKAANKAMQQSTKSMINSVKATYSAVSSMGLYNTFVLISVATTYAFSYALKAVSKAIYSIPIIGWLAAAISLIITAFKLLWDKCEGFRRSMFAIWEVVKAVFHNIGVVIKAVWENIVKPYFMFWWNLAKMIANGIWSAIKGCWDGIISGISAVGEFFTGLWDSIMNGVSAVGNFFSGLWDTLISGISAVGEFFTGLWDSLKSGIASVGEFFTGIWTWISESCGSVISFISSAFSMITEPIQAAFSGIWDYFAGLLDNLMAGISVVGEFFAGIWSWISESCGTVVAFISDAFTQIVEPIKAVFSGIWDFFSEIFGKISGLVEKFFGWVGSLWGKIFPKDQFKSLSEAAKQGQEKGSESFRKSQEDKKTGTEIPGLANKNMPTGETPAFQMPTFGVSPEQAALSGGQTQNGQTSETQKKTRPASMPKTPAAAGKSTATGQATETVNLNNIKSSTNYGAISSKLAPVKTDRLAGSSTSKLSDTVIQATTGSAAQKFAPEKQAAALAGTSQSNPAQPENQPEKTDFLRNIAQHAGTIAAGVVMLSALTGELVAIQKAVFNPASTRQEMPAAMSGLPGTANNLQRFSLAADSQSENPSLYGTGSGDPLAATATTGPFGTGNGSASSRQISFAKFCDTVEINVPQGTPQESVDYILKELMRKINGGTDEF